MKLQFLGVGLLVTSVTLAVQTVSAQTPSTVKVLGCLQGDGSDQKPWVLSGVALPAPPVAAPAATAPTGGRGGRGGGGRGGGGAGVPAPAASAPSVSLVDLRLTGGLNMSLWRGMRIEVEGTLGPRPATGPQEIRVTAARSVQGVCTPK